MSHINDDLKDLTNDPGRYVSSAKNEMARIFRIFLREHQFRPKEFQDRLMNWNGGANASSLMSDNVNNKPNARGNFVKAITKDKISFDRFFEFMCIASPLSWSITIGVRWNRGPEKGLRFNYIPNPQLYKTVTGEALPPHTVPIFDPDAKDAYSDAEIAEVENGLAAFHGTSNYKL